MTYGRQLFYFSRRDTAHRANGSRLRSSTHLTTLHHHHSPFPYSMRSHLHSQSAAYLVPIAILSSVPLATFDILRSARWNQKKSQRSHKNARLEDHFTFYLLRLASHLTERERMDFKSSFSAARKERVPSMRATQASLKTLCIQCCDAKRSQTAARLLVQGDCGIATRAYPVETAAR